MTIRALIVDDELHARQELSVLLAEFGAIEVIGSSDNGIEALKQINRLKPDVLFLDIQMPVMDGFELLNMIHGDIMPHVVFVTAYDQYSLKAFEEKTLDYLLKPVENERLKMTVAKLLETIGEKRPPLYDAEPIVRIPCLLGNRIKLINLEDVEYISTGTAGVHAVTNEGEYFTEVTLKALEERSDLLRCHKQYLVNIDMINEIVLLEGGLGKIKTKSDREIPISRRYLKLIKKKLYL